MYILLIINLDKSTFSSWKSGKSVSYNKYIDKIAEFFNVSVNYFYDENDSYAFFETGTFADEKSENLENFSGDWIEQAIALSKMPSKSEKYEFCTMQVVKTARCMVLCLIVI